EEPAEESIDESVDAADVDTADPAEDTEADTTENEVAEDADVDVEEDEEWDGQEPRLEVLSASAEEKFSDVVAAAMDPVQWKEFDRLFMEAVNQIRVDNGLNPLIAAPAIEDSALDWSLKMAEDEQISHPDDLQQQLIASGCPSGGENVLTSGMTIA